MTYMCERYPILKKLNLKFCLINIGSGAFLAFGLYNVHALSGVTEGGVLGMILLLDHWFGISPAISSAVMDLLCYYLGWRLIGQEFIAYSLLATSSFSVCYYVCEQFPPLWPQLAQMPLTAALLGAVFVGVGAGVCIRAGGAPGGDDALAMSISKLTGWGIGRIYLLTDLTVLALSTSYIPLRKMGYSLFTVILSGQIIGWLQHGGQYDGHFHE